MKRTIMLLCLGVFCAAACAVELTLVQNGKPNAVIITTAEPQAQQAAGEIQKYVAKMSGATLPIVKEGEADTTGLPVKIAIGHTTLAQKNGVKIPAGFKEVVGDPRVFEEEGFVIKTKGSTIIVGGNSDGPYRGTTYAGYEFLERLGCRFYFPGEWGEVIPEKPTLTFPETDLATKPDFALRETNLGGWIPSTPEERKLYAEWESKIKYTHDTAFYPAVGDGFLAYLLPPKEFQADHPDLYATNKEGSRKQENYENWAMLSLINPKTLEFSIANLKQAFAGNAAKSNIARIISPNGFGISPPDGAAYDFDPKAVEKNQNFNYPTYIDKPQTSEEFFGFAAKLATAFPDKWVATMAYAGREMPPQGVKLPQNFSVMYAPISSCVLHPGNDPGCWRRQETIRLMQEWVKLTPHVYVYDYNPGFLLGSFIPERDVANFTENVKLYKAMKLKGFQTEGRKAFMQTWISYYIRGKLLWNANADVEALKKDFYTNFFGSEAGPLVQAWWDDCEKALGAATIHAHEDWLVNGVYTVDFTNKLHQYVEKAGKCQMTPQQRAHFNAFALIADHLEGYAAMEEAEKNLNYTEASKQAQRMEDDKIKLTDIYSFFIKTRENPEFTSGRAKRYAEFAKMLDGTTGTLAAPIPLTARFKRDRFNEGVIGEWYNPAFDDGAWGTENTFYTWDAQDRPEDAKGHDYDGYGWYRIAVDVPANLANQPLKLHLGGTINEGWVWINGNYAGHRPWKLWWEGRQPLEMDVDATGKVKAGRNIIAIRVWNDAEIGGMLRRGFLWAPKGN